MDLLPVIISAFTITLLHTILPEHWMPFVLVGKAQKWNTKKILLVATLAATGHVLITVVLGLGVLFITTKVLEPVESMSKFITSVILIIIGFIYVINCLIKKHNHKHKAVISDKVTITSLVTLFSFSPCEAVIPLFILVPQLGWLAFSALSITILLATIIGMFALIMFTLYGYNKLELPWLEHNENIVVGMVLIALGIIIIFFR